MTDNDVDDARAIAHDAKAGERMVRDVYAFIGRFVSYPSEAAQVAHALWLIHTHLMDRWESTPRIAFLSPDPGSGKTRALEISELLVPNPVCTVNVSPAYLFRKIGTEGGVTILYDEADTVFGPKAKENEDIRGLLNAGHRKGQKVGRCVMKGKTVETEEILAYSAVALAGLGWLPDTIMSRSIIIRMRKALSREPIEPFRRRLHQPEGDRIRSLIELWARGVPANVEWPELPAGIEGRDADVWEALIVVADLIGGTWPQRARKAAVELVAASKDREPSYGLRLLTDIRLIFEGDKMPSKAIIAALINVPESPWGDLRGKPLDERGLAKRLKDYSIKSENLNMGAGNIVKGYKRESFHDVWERNLPAAAEQNCEQCGDGGVTLECALAGRSVNLHRGCVEAWTAHNG